MHLHTTSVVETGRMSKLPVLVRDRLSLARERKALVESLSTLPSKAGRDTSGGKKPWLWMPLFSLLHMGARSSRINPLKCIFKKLGQV